MGTGKPLISILMAVYEPRLDWLREQLESLEKQSYPNLRLYVRDDCSMTVHFQEIERLVKECIRSFPCELARNEENLGSNGTFERLTREAEGEYWLENQMAEALLTDEMAVIAGHRLTEEEPVSDQLLLLSMEGPREVELDISYVRAEVTAGRLLLETENGDRYEWAPAAEECVPRGSTGFVWNGNVKVEQLLVEDGYEAIRLTLGSVSALVLQPR